MKLNELTSMPPEVREQIDYHLRQMAMINCNIGIDSTKPEKTEAKRQIAEHLKEIKKLNYQFWEEITPDKHDKL